MLIALVVALLLCCMRERLPRLTGAIFGGAKGIIGAIATGDLFVSLVPAAAEWQYYTLCFWIFVSISTLGTALISAYHPAEVVIYIMVFLGAYGTTLGIDSLLTLYEGTPLPNWEYLTIFGVLCVLGAVFQCYCSGNDAAAHRKQTREKAESLTQGAASGASAPSAGAAEPLAGPLLNK